VEHATVAATVKRQAAKHDFGGDGRGLGGNAEEIEAEMTLFVFLTLSRRCLYFHACFFWRGGLL